MRRVILAATLAGLTASPVTSQEGPSPEELLNSFFYTLAVVEYCDLQPNPVAGRKLAQAAYRLQRAVGLDNADAVVVYEGVRLRLVSSPPDCTAGSGDISDIQLIIGDVQ